MKWGLVAVLAALVVVEARARRNPLPVEMSEEWLREIRRSEGL